jgi:hypothetical protein
MWQMITDVSREPNASIFSIYADGGSTFLRHLTYYLRVLEKRTISRSCRGSYPGRPDSRSSLYELWILHLMTQYLLLFWQLRSFFGRGALSDERTGLSFVYALASAAFLGSKSLGTLNHILLSQVWDFPFRRLVRLAGSLRSYSTPPPHGSAFCAEHSSSLLPATSQHGHYWPSCHRAPQGPMTIYLFSVKTFVFFFRCSSFDKKGGVGLFYNWCSLTTPEVTL